MTRFFNTVRAKTKRVNNEKKKEEKVTKNSYNNKKFQSPDVLIVPYMAPTD